MQDGDFYCHAYDYMIVLSTEPTYETISYCYLIKTMGTCRLSTSILGLTALEKVQKLTFGRL